MNSDLGLSKEKMVDLDIDIGDEVGFGDQISRVGHGDDRFRLLGFRLKKVMAMIDHLALASATVVDVGNDSVLFLILMLRQPLFIKVRQQYGPVVVQSTRKVVRVISCYNEGKRTTETLAMDYHRAAADELRLARIFNTYGPIMRDDGFLVSLRFK
ncbi:hypothetical protein M8C21_019104 [Ambrosia artemisiifolia]|uniref:Uncharacterized protein n=1 Tax=Ambrosia artemisiifolia TaxID=4212 RepID=A0AAD5D0Z5_AMBAR|nr:hypothetical protein M8C21_019104 [Ambrosia artemisiifolia]